MEVKFTGPILRGREEGEGGGRGRREEGEGGGRGRREREEGEKRKSNQDLVYSGTPLIQTQMEHCKCPY